MRIGTQLTVCYMGGGCIYSEKSDPGKICNVTMYVVSRKMTQKSAPMYGVYLGRPKAFIVLFMFSLREEGGGGNGKKMVISTSSESPASLQY